MPDRYITSKFIVHAIEPCQPNLFTPYFGCSAICFLKTRKLTLFREKNDLKNIESIRIIMPAA